MKITDIERNRKKQERKREKIVKQKSTRKAKQR